MLKPFDATTKRLIAAADVFLKARTVEEKHTALALLQRLLDDADHRHGISFDIRDQMTACTTSVAEYRH
jgi:hypothetical protein